MAESSGQVASVILNTLPMHNAPSGYWEKNVEKDLLKLINIYRLKSFPYGYRLSGNQRMQLGTGKENKSPKEIHPPPTFLLLLFKYIL